jgi:hypothetical protein
MPSIDRLRVAWSGSPVTGPGLSTFYFAGGTADPAAVSALFTACAPYVAAGVTWQVPGAGDQLDVATGSLTGSWSAAGGSTIASSGNAEHAQGVGARIRWRTNGIVNGRRVTGSTFIVPIHRLMFDTDGTLAGGIVTALNAAALAYVSAVTPDGVIWSRPAPGRAGTSHALTYADLPDAVSWLRSRRT